MLSRLSEINTCGSCARLDPRCQRGSCREWDWFPLNWAPLRRGFCL